MNFRGTKHDYLQKLRRNTWFAANLACSLQCATWRRARIIDRRRAPADQFDFLVCNETTIAEDAKIFAHRLR